MTKLVADKYSGLRLKKTVVGLRWVGRNWFRHLVEYHLRLPNRIPEGDVCPYGAVNDYHFWRGRYIRDRTDAMPLWMSCQFFAMVETPREQMAELGATKPEETR